MSTVLIIAIPVLLVLAAVMIFATGRRRATSDPEGRVTGHAQRRDPPARRERSRPREARGRGRVRGGARAGRRDPQGDRLGRRGSRDPGHHRRHASARRSTRRSSASAAASSSTAASSSRWRSASVRSAPRRSASCTPSPPAGSAARSTPASPLTDIQAFWTSKKAPFYVPEARTYLQPYPKADVPKAKKIPQYAPVLPGMEQGMVALYQKCVHLGCRVPWCQQSQWFECPCHGSKYNRVGEKRGGPAPRGLDHWVVTDQRPEGRRSTPRACPSPARRSAPTPPDRAPKARSASVDRPATPPVPASSSEPKRKP